jgi:hypothetical protein
VVTPAQDSTASVSGPVGAATVSGPAGLATVTGPAPAATVTDAGESAATPASDPRDGQAAIIQP